MQIPPDSPFLEFVYLSLFERTRKRVYTDAEMDKVEDTLLENPEDGDLMAHTGGVRKTRAANEGRGKSGSGRVAYLYLKSRQTIYFLLAFPKNVQGNLTDGQKKEVRGLVAAIKDEDWPYKQQYPSRRRSRQ
ncbi:MAG: type II toxin-antitoxin system RelE/ParE family toxin [Gemmatimonadetes bacterium]|nr:type II toxin-antitoxin system RelE/ParE family toxin [Gemmatimonadota bacterium]